MTFVPRWIRGVVTLIIAFVGVTLAAMAQTAQAPNPLLDEAIEQYVDAFFSSDSSAQVNRWWHELANQCPPMLEVVLHPDSGKPLLPPGWSEGMASAKKQIENMAARGEPNAILYVAALVKWRTALRNYCYADAIPTGSALSFQWRIAGAGDWQNLGWVLNVPAGAALELRAVTNPPATGSYYVTVETDGEPFFEPSDGSFAGGIATTRLKLPFDASGDYAYTFFATLSGDKEERSQDFTVTARPASYVLTSNGKQWTSVADAESDDLKPNRFVIEHWIGTADQRSNLADQILANHDFWSRVEPGLKPYRAQLVESGGNSPPKGVDPEALLKDLYGYFDATDMTANLSAGTLSNLPVAPGQSLGDLMGTLAYPMIALDTILKLEQAADSNEKEIVLDGAMLSALNQSLGTWLSQTFHFSYGSLTWMTGKILTTAQDYAWAGVAEKWEEQLLDWALECGWLDQYRGKESESGNAFIKVAAAARKGKLEEAMLASLEEGLRRSDGGACALDQAGPYTNQIRGNQNLPHRFVTKLVNARPDDFIFHRGGTYIPHDFYKAVYRSLIREDVDKLARKLAGDILDALERGMNAFDQWPAAPKSFSLTDSSGRGVSGATVSLWPRLRRPDPLSPGEWNTSETGGFLLGDATALDFSRDGRMVLSVELPEGAKRLFFIVEEGAFDLPKPSTQ